MVHRPCCLLLSQWHDNYDRCILRRNIEWKKSLAEQGSATFSITFPRHFLPFPFPLHVHHTRFADRSSFLPTFPSTWYTDLTRRSTSTIHRRNRQDRTCSLAVQSAALRPSALLLTLVAPLECRSNPSPRMRAQFLPVSTHRYLLGLSDLTGELMRYATNAVGAGDAGTVVKGVLSLLRDLRAGKWNARIPAFPSL